VSLGITGDLVVEKLMRWILIAVLFFVSPHLVAQSRYHHKIYAAAANPEPAKPFIQKQQRSGISNRQVAAMVKRSYSDSRILSIELKQRKGTRIYKVKTLSESGVMKYVFVDAGTGDIFE
jgi:uncharacterized membrane protein YkoI